MPNWKDLNGVRSRKADYQPPARIEQGGLIEEIKVIARTPLDDAQTRTTRCMTLESVDRVCYKIAMNEDKLSQTKVFIALMTIGYNTRYHNSMNGNQDALHLMAPVIEDCAATNDIDILDIIRGYSLFKDARSRTFRLDKSKMGEAEKSSMKCGITRAELNLFNVFAGIERVLLEESYYIDVRDERLFRIPMDEFLSAFPRFK